MSHSKSKSPKDQNVSSYKRCLAIEKVRWRGSLAEQGEVDGGGEGGINPYAKVSTRLSEMEGVQYSPDFTFISFTCVNV